MKKIINKIIPKKIWRLLIKIKFSKPDFKEVPELDIKEQYELAKKDFKISGKKSFEFKFSSPDITQFVRSKILNTIFGALPNIHNYFFSSPSLTNRRLATELSETI